MKVSAEITQSEHNEFKDFYEALAVLKEPFHCRSKNGHALQGQIQDMWLTNCESHLKMN